MRLTLLAFLGLQEALHGAVFAADFPDAGHGLRDGGTAGGSAVGGVNSLAGAVDDGGGGSRKRGRGVAGSRGSRGRDVAGGADLGEPDFELALDVGALPEKERQVWVGETPVVFGLPFQVNFVRAAGEVAAGDFRFRVFLEHGGDAGRALLVEAGRLGAGNGAEKAEQEAGKPGFHEPNLPPRRRFSNGAFDLRVSCNDNCAPTGAANCSPSLAWKPITEEPTEHCGWYAAAVNPVNAAELDAAGINSWREKFGFTKVWYNKPGKSSPGTWWEPDPHGQRSQPIGHRMTHWAELPPVPLIPEND